MADQPPTAVPELPMETLVVRKTIQATPERLFRAWTEPEQLRRWWGPEGAICVDPEVDLQVGGHYRIAAQTNLHMAARGDLRSPGACHRSL
jgi:uncharacterized protein YndB with AHSA1/START domain